MSRVKKRNKTLLLGRTNLKDIPDWPLSFAIKSVLLFIAGPLFLVVFVILSALYFPSIAEFLRDNLNRTVLYALGGIYYVFFIAYMVVKLRKRPNLFRDLGFKPFPIWTTIKYVLAYPFVYFTVVIIGVLTIISIAQALGYELTPDDIAPAKEKGFNWALFIIAVFIAPTVEEILFRGILLQAFARKYGWLKGSIFSSGIFSLIHGPVAPLVMIFSLYISRMYYKTGSIIPGIILHTINNTAVSLLVLTI